MPGFFQKPSQPKGENKKTEFRTHFSSKIKIEFQGAELSSNGGVLLYRDLDHLLNFTSDIVKTLQDSRTGKNISHHLSCLLRQSIYSKLSGHEDVDADFLKQDPIVHHVIGGKAIDHQAAGSSEIHWFETTCLTTDENFTQLSQVLGQQVMKAHQYRKLKEIIIDMDSSVSEAYGKQEGVEYNGHFKTSCYHPLFCFNQFGDLEGTLLRNSSVHSADAYEEVLQSIIDRYINLNIKNIFPVMQPLQNQIYTIS